MPSDQCWESDKSMDIEFIWNSLKHEDGIPFAKGGRGTSSLNRKPITHSFCRKSLFDIDAVSDELSGKSVASSAIDRDLDNEHVDSTCDPIYCTDFSEKAVIAHIDSDDEEDSEENSSWKQPIGASLRIERLAKALCSDHVSHRVQSLSKLKDIIIVLKSHCPLPVEMSYPPPYNESMVELNRNLPLVSDFVKPKLLEDARHIPKVLEGPREMKHVVADAAAQLQNILNICGTPLLRLIGDRKSEKCRVLAISCLQLLLLADVDTGRLIPFMIPALCSRYPPSAYDKDMDVFIQDSQLHEFYKRGGATDRQDRSCFYSQGRIRKYFTTATVACISWCFSQTLSH